MAVHPPSQSDHVGRRPIRRGHWLVVAGVAAVSVLLGGGRAVASPPCLRPPVAAAVAVPFRAPACPWCSGQRGLEYGNRPGVAVRAAGSGTVVFAGPVAGVVWVTIAHGAGVRTSYGPLRQLTVRRGASVTAGTVLATAAAALHFGVRIGGDYVDPALLLGAPVHLVPRLVAPGFRPPPAPVLRCPAGGMDPPVR